MNDERRVVVTGVGVITANGIGKEAFFSNTINGVTGIKKCSSFDASKLRTPYVGEIAADMPIQPRNPNDRGRFECIAEIAIHEMFEDSGISKEVVQAMGRKAYMSFATSLAINEKIMGFVKERAEGHFESEWLTRSPNFLNLLKQKCGVKGGCYTTTSACAAGTTAAGIGFDLIKQGKAELVIVGGVDPLTEFSCTGFHSLKSLSESVCKPFDQKRDGINIGEGGAFFVFETLERAKKRGAKIYGEILGYGINNDAYHITSPDPDGFGACASMAMAIKHSGIEKQQVDYINAHGTGTKLNDEMETRALSKFFADVDKKIEVSSNKSMIGHCLAAAGAIELAATLLSISFGKSMPNINLTEQMETGDNQEYIVHSEDRNYQYALSNSFAFAGNTASILVGKYQD